MKKSAGSRIIFEYSVKSPNEHKISSVLALTYVISHMNKAICSQSMQTLYSLHNIILFDNTLDLLRNLFQQDESAHLSKDFS